VIDVGHLKDQFIRAQEAGTNVRAIVVNNPGNPCGQVLTYENVKEILEFAGEQNVPIIADEVY
jgi:alanine transaminase